jgi:hypothetical protein
VKDPSDPDASHPTDNGHLKSSRVKNGPNKRIN